MALRADAVVGHEGEAGVNGSVAIHYHPEAYSTGGPKLMGRNAAGETFLRGYLSHGRTEAFWAQVAQPGHAQAFADAVRSAGRTEPVHACGPGQLGSLAQPGLLYLPGPGLATAAWQRAAFGHSAWSVCGITHTTASARAMDDIAACLTAPVQPWDALICTSTAVKDNVERILQAQAEHLRVRLGAQRIVLPQLPVIPLGVHTADFDFTADERHAARASLGADAQTHVVLFMGRLSFHAKAHPLAMYQALERAAQQLPPGQRVLLVECGWHANEAIAAAFADAARQACPSVQVRVLDGRNAALRRTAWAGADVCCSLADNIQETFGIVPIEAMAAGLPVVVSDWDGYRDTVRDGVDGFRVPTLMPGPGLGSDLALRHALEVDSYDVYCGLTSALVAVDIEAAALAFSRLFASPELRQRLGAQGRGRAREQYDWAHIIARYEDLWAAQQDMRRAQDSAPGMSTKQATWPARLDPYTAFAAYPTHALNASTRFTLEAAPALEAVAGESAADRSARTLARWRELAMVRYAQHLLPLDTELTHVLSALSHGDQTLAMLLAPLPVARHGAIARGLVMLTKLGVLRARPE